MIGRAAILIGLLTTGLPMTGPVRADDLPAADRTEPGGARRIPRPETDPATGTPRRKSAPLPVWSASGPLIVTAAAGVAMLWLLRRRGALPGGGVLPVEVVQVLGKRYLDARHSLQIVRVGTRILILSQSAQHGLQTLSEISDPAEADLLAGMCKQAQANSATRSFSEALQFWHAPAAPAARNAAPAAAAPILPAARATPPSPVSREARRA